MKFKVLIRNARMSPELESLVHRRIDLAFRRYSHWIRQVRVRLSDLNGPRGGVDKLVALELSVSGAESMRFEARADNYGRGLAQVLKRAKRALLDSPQLGSRRPLRGAAAT